MFFMSFLLNSCEPPGFAIFATARSFSFPGAYTPTFRSESRPDSRMEYECLPRRSKSVGRYAESSTSRDEDVVSRWRGERVKLSAPGQNFASAVSPSFQSSSSKYGTCCSNPSTLTCDDNRFALERSKTVHFHLPSYRFRDEDRRPIVSWNTNCVRCGRPKRELSWREIEYLYETLGKPGVHLETINEDLTERASASDINDRLETATRQLRLFIETLNSRPSRSPRLSPYPSSSNSVSNQLTGSNFSVSRGVYFFNFC